MKKSEHRIQEPAENLRTSQLNSGIWHIHLLVPLIKEIKITLRVIAFYFADYASV